MLAMDILQQRIRKWSVPEPNTGCWLWIGNTTNAGYSRVWDGERINTGHRISYTVFRGPVADGLTIDHLCRVRSCVNPDHLEAVTHRENVLRGNTICAKNQKKTFCVQGHAFSPDNTYWEGRKRHCRICRTARNRSRKWK